MKRRPPGLIYYRPVSAVLQQDEDKVLPVLHAGEMKGGLAVLISRVRVVSITQEFPQFKNIITENCRVERSSLVVLLTMSSLFKVALLRKKHFAVKV